MAHTYIPGRGYVSTGLSDIIDSETDEANNLRTSVLALVAHDRMAAEYERYHAQQLAARLERDLAAFESEE